MLEYVLQFKEELKKTINKIVSFNLYLLAHKRYGSDSYIVLTKLPQCRIVVSLIKNGSGIVSLNFFNCFVDEN